jgi:hypothetical protein
MKRFILISKITKIMILLGLIIHTAIFVFFAFSNISTDTLTYTIFEDRINLFALNDKWSFYADQLEAQGINSFWLLGSVDFIAQFLVLIFLYKLFALYEKGEVLTQKNCRFLHLIGITMFGYGLSMMLLPACISTIFNLFQSYPLLATNIYFGSTELSQLILGTVILVISWIMLEAVH